MIDDEDEMIGDEERRVLRAKAFAWRAIGCAVWLGIVMVIVLFALSFLPAFMSMFR